MSSSPPRAHPLSPFSSGSASTLCCSCCRGQFHRLRNIHGSTFPINSVPGRPSLPDTDRPLRLLLSWPEGINPEPEGRNGANRRSVLLSNLRPAAIIRSGRRHRFFDCFPSCLARLIRLVLASVYHRDAIRRSRLSAIMIAVGGR